MKKKGSGHRGKGASRRGLYEVGYGKPPKHSQWGPGESGNKKGRPKKRPLSVDAMMLKIMEEITNVVSGGVEKKMPRLEVLLRRLWAEATKGNSKALRFIVDNFLLKKQSEDYEAEEKRIQWEATSAKLDEMADKYRPKLLAMRADEVEYQQYLRDKAAKAADNPEPPKKPKTEYDPDV